MTLNYHARHAPWRACSSRPNSAGTVLIVTMWVVLVLAGLTLVFARAMRVETLASANRLAAAQAEWIARGALSFVVSQVDGTDGLSQPGKDVSCEAVAVGTGYFWLLKPPADDFNGYQFGIIDETGKINVNYASKDILLKLPGMTDEFAASILDWRSGTDDATPGGAKSEYYLLLSPPYLCKNGPIETVEELLLVKGATLPVVFGEDANRNAFLDANENDADEREPADDRNGTLDRGIYDYVTVHSNESNVERNTEQLIDVNSTRSNALTDLLQKNVSQARIFEVLDRVRSGRPFASILDFYFRAGLTLDEFRKIASQIAVFRGRTRGLLNVNTASKQALLCLPSLDDVDVTALMKRRAAPDVNLKSIAWVADALTAEKAAAIGGEITARSYQFSADIVAVSGDARAFKRYRTVLDARTSPPRVVVWQDLTALGWPLAPEILAALRGGKVLSS